MFSIKRVSLLVIFGLFQFVLGANQDLDQPKDYKAGRASSYRTDGANGDKVEVPGHSSYTVADLKGAGRIVHTWFTLATAEPNYLQTTKIKMYWDGNSEPAVDVPFGDFHALGHHGVVRQVESSLVTVVARPELNTNLPNKNVAGFNTFFPMPFGKGARIVIENNSDHPLDSLYFQIDYQKQESEPSPLRFHALYRETPPEEYPGPAQGRFEAKNEDGKDNHLILDIKGKGHLIGLVLSVDAMGVGWWEGDEMIWIDGDSHPTIYGTGTEDYFCGAWGFRQEYNTLYHGVSVLEKVPERNDWRAGKFSVYRFHVLDPIPFTKSLKFSIERGHNNHRKDCPYSSVVYWYQQ